MYFCVPRSPDICLHCLMLLDFVHRIADIVHQLYSSNGLLCRTHSPCQWRDRPHSWNNSLTYHIERYDMAIHKLRY